MIKYKRYIGHITYDEEAKIFHGEVINTRDVITFQGRTVEEIEKEFKNSIDDYISWCKEEGVKPEKPYSGKFNVRIPPDLHERIVIAASSMNMSLNRFVEKSLIDELNVKSK
ncbi:type II toxin-antitoxin system HicB family antitoxin [bacterium]|nr:type II toxin-antitoxin system HicB family antitoxin [bacterium]